MANGLRRIWLLRHGATEWALNGRHTGNTDVPLLPEGEEEAKALAPILETHQFAAVYSSPLQRARRTCELGGLGKKMQILDDIIEWNYGDYEGITTATIRETVPDWTVWTHPCPNGENTEEVQVRCERAIATAINTRGVGDVAFLPMATSFGLWQAHGSDSVRRGGHCFNSAQPR